MEIRFTHLRRILPHHDSSTPNRWCLLILNPRRNLLDRSDNLLELFPRPRQPAPFIHHLLSIPNLHSVRALVSTLRSSLLLPRAPFNDLTSCLSSKLSRILHLQALLVRTNQCRLTRLSRNPGWTAQSLLRTFRQFTMPNLSAGARSLITN